MAEILVGCAAWHEASTGRLPTQDPVTLKLASIPDSSAAAHLPQTLFVEGAGSPFVGQTSAKTGVCTCFPPSDSECAGKDVKVTSRHPTAPAWTRAIPHRQ